MPEGRESQTIESPDNDDSQINEFPTISYDERLRLAQETWKQSNGAISIAKAANMHVVNKSTLRDRIKGAASKDATSLP